MARYPREFSWQTDPDTDTSVDKDSSPATERYPLEWGNHLASDPDVSKEPAFTPVMQTLLGAADPDSSGEAGSTAPNVVPTDAWQQCHDQYVGQYYLGGGHDRFLLYRRCVRECLSKKGHEDYLIEPK